MAKLSEEVRQVRRAREAPQHAPEEPDEVAAGYLSPRLVLTV